MKNDKDKEYNNEFSFLDNIELDDDKVENYLIKKHRGVIPIENFVKGVTAPAKVIKVKKVYAVVDKTDHSKTKLPTKKVHRQNRKGLSTSSDYINFDTAMRTGVKLLQDDKKKIIGLYIIFSINTGLRVTDVLSISWRELLHPIKKGNEVFISVLESKTKKRKKTKPDDKPRKPRIIKLNDAILKALSSFDVITANLDKKVFTSQKNSVFSVQQLNRILKDVFSKESKEYNISTHSLRKTFGRQVYENNNQSEHALIKLSDIFQHSKLSITRLYLGIRQSEINDIYDNL